MVKKDRYIIAVKQSEDGHIVPNERYSCYNYNRYSEEYCVLNSRGYLWWYSKDIFSLKGDFEYE